MPVSIDDFLGGFRAPQVVVSLTQRADLVAEHQTLTRQLDQAVRDDLAGGGHTAAEIRGRLADLEEQIAASSIEVTLRALGSQEYQRLLADHPPTPDARKAGIGFNLETFPAALIAACAVDPEISVEQAAQLCDRLSDGQFTKLWNAALLVNVGDDTAPKSVLRSATADRSATSSTTAAAEESLAASSSDES